MKTSSFPWRCGVAAICSVGALVGGTAYADRARPPADTPPVYRNECGSCHVAYPPGMLPGASWQRLMTQLDRHYGTDASLDPETVQRLSTWLQSHAGTMKRLTEQIVPEDRITRTAWFERKHRRLDDVVWRLPSVKSAANCAACHSRAEEGSYRERELRLPDGLPARYRGAFLDD